MNETGLNNESANAVTSDSIFRVMSVSKNIAMTSALIVSNHPNQLQYPGLILEAPVRLLLPNFTLPEPDWNDGGSEITVGMLAAQTAGITRESYNTELNMILKTGKTDLVVVGDYWANATVESVMDAISGEKLMFAPGQRPGYSNAGVAILGVAIATCYNNITNSDMPWSQIATRELLEPLNMTHSFFGQIPQDLEPFMTVPGGDNWADIIVAEGYAPAGGMWSSATDLAKYVYAVWLSPSPILITQYQRRRSLKPVASLPDGKQQVGAGWEINRISLNTNSNATQETQKTKPYSIFGKTGDGGGWHSWIDIIPNLGYGIVALTQRSGLQNYSMLHPTMARDIVHEILAPAFAEALAARMSERFAGAYTVGKDTGLLPDQVVPSNSSNITRSTYARLEVENHILYLRELVVNGSSPLEEYDRLSGILDLGLRYYSSERGVVLEPAEGAAENAEFGEGAQVWRLIGPDQDLCDWFTFDAFKDTRGWPVVKVVLIETEDGVELRYPPYDIAITRT
ncbi:beta-lactamase/transpeptidase-like protein [Pyrenochaeta sp. MPI-SDFR-AT-0127]|nr:beta-lactamase/transpeptidase-like protein [Pyrenochaeta sp. MPI-SDFR-AT-0127]